MTQHTQPWFPGPPALNSRLRRPLGTVTIALHMPHDQACLDPALRPRATRVTLARPRPRWSSACPPSAPTGSARGRQRRLSAARIAAASSSNRGRGHLAGALAGERCLPLLLNRCLLRHCQRHRRRRWRRRGQRQPGQRRLAGTATKDGPPFVLVVDVDVCAELAPRRPAATALADVLGLRRILAGLLGHLAADALERLEIRQVGGRVGLGKLASLHHLSEIRGCPRRSLLPDWAPPRLGRSRRFPFETGMARRFPFETGIFAPGPFFKK